MTLPTQHDELGTPAPRALRPGLGTTLRHLLVLAIMVGGFCTTVYVFLFSYTGQWIDETALAEVSNELIGLSDSTEEFLDFLPYVAGGLGVLGLVLVLLLRRRFGPVLLGVAVAAAADGSAQVLKHVIISKPNLGIQEAVGNSLPSGHTTFAMSAGAAVFLAAPKAWRPFCACALGAMAAATGISTVINGWHRPADVIAAMFLVGAWTVVGLWILRFLPSEAQDLRDTRHSGMVLVPLLSIFGLFAAFCAVATYLVAGSQQFPGAALLGSVCLISAVALLTTAQLITLLRQRERPEERCYRKVWTY